MKNEIRALIIKRDDKNNLIVNDKIIIDDLEHLYKELEADTINIQERKINGSMYDFIIDDEYMLNGKSQEPKNAVAIGIKNGDILEVIFGNLIICGLADKNGKETSLNDYDILKIKSAINGAQLPNNEIIKVITYTF